MTQLSALIKEHIQHIEQAEVVEFLLSHLNEQATLPSQLFCKHITHAKPGLSTTLHPQPLPNHLLVLAVFYAYAPNALVAELADILSRASELFTSEPGLLASDTRLVASQQHTLTDYLCARPLLQAIATNGAELISLLANADSTELNALIRLCDDPQLSELYQNLLSTNTAEIDTPIKQRLIALISLSQFNNQLQLMVQTIELKAATALSLSFLFRAFSTQECGDLALKQLNRLLHSYPCAIDRQVEQLVYTYYLEHVRSSEQPMVGHAYIELLIQRLDTLTRPDQLVWLGHFDTEFVLKLMDQCLLAVVDYQWPLQRRCVDLILMLSTEHGHSDALVSELLCSQLSYANSYLFTNAALQKAAKIELGAEVDELWSLEQWYRLLSSPKFVAQCSVNDLAHLNLRYGLLSLLQKATDETFPQAQAINSCLAHIQVQIEADVEPMAQLIADKYQLLQFSLQCRIQQVTEQLTEQCYKPDAGTDVAPSVLYVLHDYYQLIYPQLRVDLALRPVIFACRQRADMRELNNYLVNQADYLSGHEQLDLFDNTGSCIGLLTQNNHALSFTKYGVMPLANYHPHRINQTLYNEHGTALGVLSAESTMVNQAYDKAVIARLLTALLSSDAVASELLGRLILRDRLLATVFVDDTVIGDGQLRAALEYHMATLMIAPHSQFEQSQITAVLEHFSSDAVFALLRQLAKGPLALALFEHIIAKPQLCQQLFDEARRDELDLFNQRQQLVHCFTRYLLASDVSHWSIGLSYFAEQQQLSGEEQLLQRALKQAKVCFTSKPEGAARYDSMLANLLSCSNHAALVVERFCQQQIRSVLPIDSTNDLAALSSLWSQDQLFVLLDALNKIPCWDHNARYTLALHILLAHYPALADNDGLTHLSLERLQQLSFFICRHVADSRAQDPDFHLGYRVITILAARLAQLGHMGLFYVQGRYNAAMAGLSLPMAATIEQQAASVGNQQALLSLYLSHYTGDSAPVIALIKRYLTNMTEPRKNLHHLSRLMVDLPDSDLAAVIFAELQCKLVVHPQLLNASLMQHMACYYKRSHVANAGAYATAELSLLHYFGQQKQYDLVLVGCRLLSHSHCESEFTKDVARFALEASVEARLSMRQERFYFRLLQFVLRLWHYGFAGISKVTPCDKLAPISSFASMPTALAAALQHQPVVDVALECGEGRRQFINLLTTIKRIPTDSLLTSRIDNRESEVPESDSQDADNNLVPQGGMTQHALVACSEF